MHNLSTILGGIGLFLLGMTLLTEGLKAYAGDGLRNILIKFVTGKFSAILCGVTVAALVQSSSATILATIGFVSAGLLTFSQAVGVVLGANIGTTSTTWIVSLLGLKYSISVLAMPIIFIGVILMLFAKDKRTALGTALAGFGLIFVALDLLQVGMASYSGVIQDLLDQQFGSSKILLLLLGVLTTVIMQSSSAALATTLTALHQGVISYEQALALAIGQNIGTTATAIIASIAASRAAQRTALCHIIFNLTIGVVALMLLPWLSVICWDLSESIFGQAEPLIAISFFHTIFNVGGVLLFVPWLNKFSRFIEYLLPDNNPGPLRFLDISVIQVTSVALETAYRAVAEVAQTLSNYLSNISQQVVAPKGALADLEISLEGIKEFLGKLGQAALSEEESVRFLSLLHAIDHLERILLQAKDFKSVQTNGLDGLPVRLREEFFSKFNQLFICEESEQQNILTELENLSLAAEQAKKQARHLALERAARREALITEALKVSEQARFWDSILAHYARVAHYLFDNTPKDIVNKNS